MFRFRLEPLITIRDNVLKEKQAELAKAYEARRIVEEKQRELEVRLAENLQAGRDMMQGGRIDVDYLLGLRRQEMFLIMERDENEKRLRMIDREIENRRLAVVEANKELKVVEKLKEKQKERHDAEEARKETVMMDEIALRRVDS